MRAGSLYLRNGDQQWQQGLQETNMASNQSGLPIEEGIGYGCGSGKGKLERKVETERATEENLFCVQLVIFRLLISSSKATMASTDLEIAKTKEERRKMEQQLTSLNSVTFDTNLYGV
ncbi:hypothetical protein F8388_017273 [Cannabis sativa]|uniref:Uncharacterized protein n=1 Tax=Cannabis sativa TaxID=3483 RepID=A0A7J6FX50_CANSA|nr:hypothetical protein F8388_017273 [Cannabis sativa]